MAKAKVFVKIRSITLPDLQDILMDRNKISLFIQNRHKRCTVSLVFDKELSPNENNELLTFVANNAMGYNLKDTRSVNLLVRYENLQGFPFELLQEIPSRVRVEFNRDASMVVFRAYGFMTIGQIGKFVNMLD